MGDAPFTSQFWRRREFGIAVMLLTTFVVAGIANPGFLGAANLADMLSACAPCVIVACGVALVVITGEIDISVGSMYGLLAAMIGLLSSPAHADLPTVVVVPLVLIAGATLGLLNGVLVTLGRVPSIIVTLGALTILRGATDVMLGGVWITQLPASLREIGTATPLGLSIAVWTAIAIALGAVWFTRSTRHGRRMYAVGDNPDAARLAGMSERRAKLLAFTISGLLTGVAAVVSVPQLSVIESGMGIGFELLVITAVVVGRVSVQGGIGSIIGVVLAALLLGIVRTVLVFLKPALESLHLGSEMVYWERSIHGVFILSAVVLDHFSRRRGAGGHDSSPGPSASRDTSTWSALESWVLLAVACAALLIGAGLSRPEFLSLQTQQALIPQVAEMALLAVPMTLIILSGGIDLSVGSVMALAAVATGLAFERGIGVWPAAGIGVLVGAACGLMNGVFITRGHLHPLIVTLATMSLFRGVAEGLSAAQPVSGFPDTFTSLATARVAGVPLIMLPVIVAFGLAGVVLWRVVAGRHIRAIGHNETAARYCGIGVDRLKLWLYTLSGAAAGLAAVMLIARRNTAKADAGLGIELDVITAVVLGGTSIAGGRGTLVGVALAVVLLHELRQFIAWRWYHDEYVLPVVGVVLIASVLFGQAWERRR